MTYGFYQFVRFTTAFGFLILANKYYHQYNHFLMAISIGVAILFQPLFKVALGREICNIVDILVALFLIISLFFDYKDYKGNSK